MRKINYIVIHHSLTNDGKVVDWQAIRNWHIGKHPESPYNPVNGGTPWRDIGYHFGVERIGGLQQLEILIGRPLDIKGAHAPKRNHDSIGVCFVGDYEHHKPSDRMISVAVRRLIVPMVKIFNIPVNHILPHNFVNNTECPGKMFPMEFLKSVVKDRL